jgi:hypothetical protein
MKTTCRSEADRALSELQQQTAIFKYRGKAFPPKALQQVVCQAEVAYYERADFDSVLYLSQVGAATADADAADAALARARAKPTLKELKARQAQAHEAVRVTAK